MESTEHRGWEIANDFHQHWMDDPEYDLAVEKVESGNGTFALLVIVSAILCCAMLGAKWYLSPPVESFRAPPVPAISNYPTGSIILPPGTPYMAFRANVRCHQLPGKAPKQVLIACTEP